MARTYSDYQSEYYLDSPRTFRMFPGRYGAPLSDGRKAGARKEHMFFLNNYFNSYALPSASLNLESGAGEVFRRLYGNRLYVAVKPRSLRDLIRLYAYETGLFSTGDLIYYLGISEGYVSDFIAQDMKRRLNLMRYEGAAAYTKWFYYVYRPKKEPYLSYPFPSPIDYAAKTLSARSIPHTYSIGLSQLTMRLYCVARPDYHMEFAAEVPLGNFRFTTPGRGKAGSELAADGLFRVWKGEETIPHVLLLEQDMGTEPYAVLLQKLRDYGATGFFSGEVAEKSRIILSCHKLLSADRSFSYPFARFVALYFCMCAYTTFTCREDAFHNDSFDILAYILEKSRGRCEEEPYDGKKLSALFSEADSLLYRNFYRGYFFYMAAGTDSLWGLKLDDILSEIGFIRKKGYETAKDLFSLLGIYDYQGKYTSTSLTLGRIQEALSELSGYYDREPDLLMRLKYNQRLYGITREQYTGLCDAIIRVLHGLRSIDKKTYSDQIDETMYFAPLFDGYSLYVCPSALLTNYMPYILWDTDSTEIQHLLGILGRYFPDALSAYTPFSPTLDLTNGTTSHRRYAKDGLAYPFRLRNCYRHSAPVKEDAMKWEAAAGTGSETGEGIQGNDTTNTTERAERNRDRTERYRMNWDRADSGGSNSMAAGFVCVEDLDADAGAWVRAYQFMRFYAGDIPVKLVLLVDSISFARDFLFRLFQGHSRLKPGLIQSDRCRVSIFDKFDNPDGAIDSNCIINGRGYGHVIRKTSMDYSSSTILFLEKGSRNSLDKLFSFSTTGELIIYENF